VDVEAVRELEGVAGVQFRFDGLEHRRLDGVRHEHRDDVGLAGRLRRRLDAQAVGLGGRPRGGVFAQADDDVDAAVREVLRVGVTLATVAEYGDGLVVDVASVCVRFVVHWLREI